jgi:hypothetical protein
MGPVKILIASAFAVGVAGSAVAADMPAAYKVAPVARPACAQFGGWYVGANVGYGYLDIISRTATLLPRPSIPDFPGARGIRRAA